MTENYNTLLGDGNDVPLSGEESAPELPLAQSDAVMALASATSELARAISKISYTPTRWVDNSEPDINAANLNKIEQGILQATTAINGAVDAINAINGNLSNRFAINKQEFSTINDFPEYGSCFGVANQTLTLYEGFSIPAYSRIIFINYTDSKDAALIAVAYGGKTYTAFRNRNIWQDGKILISNTDLRFYSTTNGITKIASLPWGIYNLQDSEVRALTDKPSELNQGRAIIITSGLSTNDEKVALILASSGRDGGVYFGYVWGSNTPEFSWKKIIGNNA